MSYIHNNLQYTSIDYFNSPRPATWPEILKQWIQENQGETREAADRIANWIEMDGRSLDLNDLRLTSLLDIFGHPTTLRDLNLGCNQLRDLPESITQFAFLRILELNNNHITVPRELIRQLLPSLMILHFNNEGLGIQRQQDFGGLPRNVVQPHASSTNDFFEIDLKADKNYFF